MNPGKRGLRIPAGIALLASTLGSTVLAAATPLPLDLAFSRDELRRWDQPVVSSDGHWVAFEPHRPPKRAPGSELGAEPRYLPNGTPASVVGLNLQVIELSAAGAVGDARSVCTREMRCWRPSFSPDNKKLAFYSDDGGLPQLWVYDLRSGERRKIADAPIKAKLWAVDVPAWTPDGREIVVPIDPKPKPAGGPGAATATAADAGSASPAGATKSDAPTVTVHRTDAAAVAAAVPQGPDPRSEHFINENNCAIAAINVETGKAREIAPAVSEARPANMTLSPDAKWVVHSTVWTVPTAASSTMLYDLVAVPAAGGERRVFAREVETTDRFYTAVEWLWGEGGKSFVFTKGKKLYVASFGAQGPGEPRQLAGDLGDLNDYPFLLSRDGRSVLVGLMPEGPVTYYRVTSKKLALVPLDGSAPRVIEATGTPVRANLTTLWQPDGDAIHLVRADERTGENAVVRRDLGSGVERELWRGNARLDFAGATTDGSIIARYESLDTPPDLFLFDRSFQKRRISKVEPRLDGIAVGSMKRFDAQIPTFDGSLVTVQPAIFLPQGAREGEPLPTLVYFYAGSQYSQSAQDYGGGAPNSIPVQIFTSRGYAVLFVDTPMSPQGGEGGNPIQEMTESILAQVYRGAALGYVDISRVAITGQSYGGYGTASVITYTNLFRAAIAMSGIYDLVASYGTMSVGGSFNFTWSETGQGRMGTHPWNNLQRYIDNSPYERAARIQTPLLMIHGRADLTCPVDQAEKMFNAMKRLERVAELAVYDGEGHVPGAWSLVNAVDAGQRMLDFLARYLVPSS